MSARRKSSAVRVGNVTVGGAAPIIVQSMTNTDTADIDGTVAQVKALARAGSELVRVTVNNDESAAAVPHIRERLDAQGVPTPWWAISTSMATSCSRRIPPAPKPWRSSESIRGTWEGAASATRSSRK